MRYRVEVDSFYGLTRADLNTMLGSPQRAARVFQAIYRDHAVGLRDLPSVPAEFRKRLESSLILDLPAIHTRYESRDGTTRYLLSLADAQLVEAVLIPSADRDTFCISSQIGCALGCTFCSTGRLGWIRDLSAAEIVQQVVVLRNNGSSGKHDRFSIVFMGMGEPLQNYDAVIKAIRILSDDHGLAVPPARITVSTAGLIPGLKRLASEPVFPNVSISLTGIANDIRDTLMPINRRYPVEQVIETIRALPGSRQRRVMLECVMIRDLTDSLDDAYRLSALVEGIPLKVNLIPLNAAPDLPFEPASRASILKFQEVLVGRGVPAFIRKTRGDDISGACGQLRRVTLQAASHRDVHA